jgi:hypothetical protein
MKPIAFKGHNTVIAKDQPEYLPLPAHVSKGDNGEVISCWKMSWRERIKALLRGKVWLCVWTFNAPLQPQRMEIDCPLE